MEEKKSRETKDKQKKKHSSHVCLCQKRSRTFWSSKKREEGKKKGRVRKKKGDLLRDSGVF